VIALDTNVLVRYLVEDDAEQSAAAGAVIDRAIAADEQLVVSDVVLCETVWVLTGAYRVGRARVGDILADLIRAKHLSFAAPDELARAIRAYAAGRGDFADYVIREHARSAGCESVATFDRALLREPGFIEAG
jgi:predicted nucleic-acid-binding protein